MRSGTSLPSDNEGHPALPQHWLIAEDHGILNSYLFAWAMLFAKSISQCKWTMASDSDGQQLALSGAARTRSERSG